ncbi:family A1 protease [Lentinus brumalis]|uniref:Family A1 protease n=1 Tax=Lentinus brumalis TaxID=2498619 RepID=A0A371D8J7_9APHY|nr:family A1 protease [Polyporus brumalis]
MLSFLFTVVLTLTLLLFTHASAVRRDGVPITLPVVKRVNTPGTAKLLESDQARAKALKEGHRRPPKTVPATNQLGTYVAAVSIGEPAQTFSLLVDIASSNTWVGAQPVSNPYHPSTTAHDTGEWVSVLYGAPGFTGEEYYDTVTLHACLDIKNQSFGVAEGTYGFDRIDGFLGIGPTALTIGTLRLSPNQSIPTVTDNAYSQGLIHNKKIGISFEPTTSDLDTNGELTFGGVNENKFTGPLHFVPITTTSPANNYVGIDQEIAYNNQTILPRTAGIVDTRTALVLLAEDAYNKYQTATGATVDDDTGLLKITRAQYENLHSLLFKIGSTNYVFTANAQIWPRALNNEIGGKPDGIYLVVANLGSSSGGGLDFILGCAFLERFYHVYDSENNQAGFAATPFTHATTN